IGIDISQIAHEKTGVANYVQNMVQQLLEHDGKNEYILFYSSLRKRIQNSKFKIQNSNSKFKIKEFWLPPSLLDVLWNRFHIVPIEWFIGNVDVFISSDWVQPPTRAKSITILYDLIVYTYPEETARKIVQTQKRRLKWVKKECDKIICISESTKKDAEEILKIDKAKLAVVYPGI
ncbi:MAG: glycosyltransferase, partial [Candidatus Levybacteria bacterium]|nr:glycosyltransferase [Candidatus Levybacteria bacterium]